MKITGQCYVQPVQGSHRKRRIPKEWDSSVKIKHLKVLSCTERMGVLRDMASPK